MNRLSQVFLLLCAVLLAPAQPGHAASAHAAVSAASQAPITWLSSLGGSINGGAVDGTNAYLIEGANLTVLDLTNPSAPRFRSHVPLLDIAQQIVAANGFVYLLSRHSSLAIWIYDVRDPAAPRFVRELPFPAGSSPINVQLASGALWVTSIGTDNVHRFDLGNPAAPVLTNTLTCSACHIQTSGSLAYLLDQDSHLQVWDLSDPHAPQLRAQSVLAGLYSFTGFVLSGNRLYVAGWSQAAEGGSRRALMTLDVSDPSRPAVQATVVANVGELSVAGDRLVTLFDQTLWLYSMANPAQPTLVFSQTLDATSYQVVDNTLYAASARAWSILDLSGTSGAVLRGQFTATLTRVQDVSVEGQRLYARVPDGIQIIDVSNPLSPTLQARVSMLDAQEPAINGKRLLAPEVGGRHMVDAGSALGRTVPALLRGHQGLIQGNLLYQLTSVGLDILDITNPASPVLLGSASFPMHSPATYDLFVAGGRAYISIIEARYIPSQRLPILYLTLRAVDVSNPQQPRTGGSISDVKLSGITTKPNNWAISGTALFIALNGLFVIDVSNIDSPTLSDYHYDGAVTDVQIVGSRAYIAGSPALSVLDLTDPLHPTTVSTFKVGLSTSHQVQIVNERAYILLDGLRVLDIRNPSTPLPQAMYGSYVLRMAVAEPYVYLALDEGGLQIVQIHPEHFRQPLLLPLVLRH